MSGPNALSAVDYFAGIIKCAITGEKIAEGINYEENFDEIMKLSRLHEVSHLAASAMLNTGLKDEEHIKTAEKSVFDAAFSSTKNHYTYNLTAEILSKAGIEFVPLKGAIIRKLYPEEWMRTSCDIDVLIHKEDFEKAVNALEQAGFKPDERVNFHDISLKYDNTNLELHFSICEDAKNIDKLLEKVWEYTEPGEGYMRLEIRDFFAFHHIAHMLHHFMSGGCGIRPFLDMWILKKNGYFENEAVKEMCQKTHITVFYDYMLRMTDVWFEEAEHSDITRKIQKYILKGGAYGYYPNGAAANTVLNGGKVRHLLSLAFPSYKGMCILYPTVEKAPVLLPAFYMYRLVQKFFDWDNTTSKNKYRIIRAQDNQLIKEVSELIKTLKLEK